MLVGRYEVPDCLAIWWRNRGVQLYWSGRPHVQRLSIRDEPPPPEVVERGRELAERYRWDRR